MLRNYKEIREKLNGGPVRTVSIAAPKGDAEILEAVRQMEEAGFAKAILVDEADDLASAKRAAKFVRDGEADVLMKGLLNTSDFLRGVLDKEDGIRGEGILSHFASFETPGQERLIIQTDGGMNMYPGLEEKVKILKNAVDALHRLGVGTPNVAALSANEAVNEKMVSSVDADALAKMCAAGGIPGCFVEGPIALDVALSKDAARHKRIESRIAGETDLFLVPDIDAGNIMGKTLVCCAGAKMAGVVLGARAPIVLVSRSDNAESKVNSLALACALL
ncbi:MAG: phosphate butyryltransferase [Clostridiales Family XIII bacterium]|jgi:phosphate butyryltransferase|nr:phosphate butyryltransferase [Clostridiales Family XIII bacterium]